MVIDISKHPCFNDTIRHQFGRIHLPIAPKCNLQCNYCNRKFDCANENRPGVTSVVLSPRQALTYLQQMMEKDPSLAVAGIAGPGDAFATPDETLEALRLIRSKYPDLLLCVASNGFNLPAHVSDLATIGVSHVTITINAVNPDIGGMIYSWARDGKVIYRTFQAAELLWQRQQEAIRRLKQQGVTVKINTIYIPGVNDDHIPEIAKTVARLRADIFNCIPIYSVKDTPFEFITPPSSEEVHAIRTQAKSYLPQMNHCTRCRADAVGKLGSDANPDQYNLLRKAALLPLDPEQNRPYVAVASREGILVNQHLGEAESLLIFKKNGAHFVLVEERPAPNPGGGTDRWAELARRLHDCRAILVNSAGDTPKTVLYQAGIRLVMMEGLIEEGLESIFDGKELRAPLRREHRCGSGSGCGGTGTGCM